MSQQMKLTVKLMSCRRPWTPRRPWGSIGQWHC